MQQQMHPVLTIKGARVGDFNGKSLSTVSSSIVATDPDIPECLELQQWYSISMYTMIASHHLTIQFKELIATDRLHATAQS